MNPNKKNDRPMFNIVDVVIALAVIAAGALLWMIISASGTKALTESELAGNQSAKIRYVVTMQKLPAEMIGSVEKDIELFTDNQLVELGDVVDVVYTPYSYIGYNTYTKRSQTYTDERYTRMDIHVTARAVDKDGVYFLTDTYPMLVGKQVKFRTETFVGTGYCMALSVETSSASVSADAGVDDKEADTHE